MAESRRLTAVIEREGDGYVALCPEVDVASQGDTIEEARANLQDAVELFFEVAGEAELRNRLGIPVQELRFVPAVRKVGDGESTGI